MFQEKLSLDRSKEVCQSFGGDIMKTFNDTDYVQVGSRLHYLKFNKSFHFMCNSPLLASQSNENV